VTRLVGRTCLDRGILFGRYDRCDVGLLGAMDSRLSRVHMMIVRHGDSVLAIDNASTNGTHISCKEIHMIALSDGDRLDLGGELEVVWELVD
jgi:pSer/pThr/pTyr-binding forkhead associated (FHA) protein